MDWSIYSKYRLIYKLDGVHRLIHSLDRPPVDVHDNSVPNVTKKKEGKKKLTGHVVVTVLVPVFSF